MLLEHKTMADFGSGRVCFPHVKKTVVRIATRWKWRDGRDYLDGEMKSMDQGEFGRASIPARSRSVPVFLLIFERFTECSFSSPKV